jgi:gas vesicle protein
MNILTFKIERHGKFTLCNSCNFNYCLVNWICWLWRRWPYSYPVSYCHYRNHIEVNTGEERLKINHSFLNFNAMSTGKILVGVLAGVAIGAAIGVMFAPHVGSSTRRKLSKKGEKYFEEVKEAINEMVDEMADKFASVEEDAGKLFEKGKKKADLVHEKVKGNGHHAL